MRNDNLQPFLALAFAALFGVPNRTLLALTPAAFYLPSACKLIAVPAGDGFRC